MAFTFKEEIYNSNLPIKYVLEEGENNKNELIVVFSGFNGPNAIIQHSYNYMRALKGIDCNKLFILDSYGSRGCYYLGENMKFDVETSVISLISYISRKLDIQWKNIISVGSSKGGSAALYFGLKYNFGAVIAGAPQIKIADYVLKVTEETAQFMLGDIENRGKIEKLNSLIYEQLEKNITTKINIFSSENDWQYKSHVEDFLITLKNKKIPFDVTIDNNMASHGEIGKYFPEYLISKLLMLKFEFVFEKPQFIYSSHKCEINIKSNMIENIKSENIFFKFISKSFKNIKLDALRSTKVEKLFYKYIVKTGKDICIEEKTEKPNFVFIPSEPNLYFFEMEIHSKYGLYYTMPLGQAVMGLDYFNFTDVSFEIEDNYIYVDINLEAYKKLTYAFYIFHNNVVIEKIFYQNSNKLKYQFKNKGKYSVQCFIKTEDNKIVIYKTLEKEV